MQEFEEDYYAVLGVEEDAAQEEVRKAYLKLAKKLHPDRFPNDETGKAAAQDEFRRVTQAQYVIGDAQRRAEYDNLRVLAKARRGGPVRQEAAPDGQPGPQATESPPEPGVSSETINAKWAVKHLSRADDLFRRKRYQEAETAVKEAIRLMPNDVRYHNKLAEIYLARGWKTYAMTEVQAALRIDPKDAEARNLETRLKALSRGQQAGKPEKKSFLDQIKEILNKKK